MSALFTPHARSLTVEFGDVERHASSQMTVFVGTAGSVIERKNADGFRFYAHQSYEGDGKQHERYLAGPVGDAAADAAAEAVRERIRELKALVPTLRMLIREGYAFADAKTYATVAALHNAGVFRAGAMLVGSHAFGALLNALGVRAASFATEDIDVARNEELALDAPAQMLDVLRRSGVDFVEVPRIDRKHPSTSWKQRGRSSFHVDLLVPSPDETFPVVTVPELSAHATGLPYLGYLLAESQPGALLAREGCCAVRVPLPERFAVHKIAISRLRTGRNAKSLKDVTQACVLAAAVAELSSGALTDAVAALPKRMRKHYVAGLDAARELLEEAHPRAWAELTQ
jgi:hypothetical protein